MSIPFSKMHGLGNDFMVLDNRDQAIELTSMRIRQWSSRHWGVGFDQLLVVEKPQQPNAQFSYRIFNADGKEVEHCGNGARCFARFVHNQQLTDLKVIVVDTIKGQLELTLDDNGYVSVQMGVPTFVAEEIPLNLEADKEDGRYHLEHPDTEVKTPIVFDAVAIGNPHAVLLVDCVHTAPVETLGAYLESHDVFPNNANIGFMEVIDRNNFNLRVYERGVGETQACGSGACAAAVIGMRAGRLADAVTAHLKGGNLEISWAGEGEQVFMRGPAVEVFRGELKSDDE